MCKHREGCQRALHKRHLKLLPYILISIYYCLTRTHTFAARVSGYRQPVPYAPALANYKSSNQFQRVPVQRNRLQWHTMPLYLAATWRQAAKQPASFQCLHYKANNRNQRHWRISRCCTAENLRRSYWAIMAGLMLPAVSYDSEGQ